MDGGREPRGPFSDASGKKIEFQKQSSVPPVKRPRQKGLQFELTNGLQQQPFRNEYPPADLSMQLQGFYTDVGMTGNEIGHWYPEVPHFPRRDTPVPEADIEDVRVVGEPATPPPPSPVLVQQWLRKNHMQQQQRPQRPLQPPEMFTAFSARRPLDEGPPPPMTGHPVYQMESLEDRMANSPFSPSQRERDRFMETMNSPVPPSIVDPYRWPGTPVMPQPQHVRRMTSPAAGGLLGEGSGLDEYSPAYAAAKEWDGGHPYKEMEAALAGRLQQSRRSPAPGPNREPADLGSYLARQQQQQQQHHHHQHQQQQQHPQPHQHQNTRSEFRCPAEAGMGRHPGRVTAMRERLRRLDHRRMPLEDRQEQDLRATVERHKARQQAREHRIPCRGEHFGALMNVLGLVPDDDIPGNARDSSSGISRMREAVFGIVSSGLPPHLLFSDRDFDGDDYEFLSRLDDSVESKKGADDQIINRIDLCAFGSDGLHQKKSTAAAAAALTTTVPTTATIPISSTATPTPTDPRCPICLEDFAEGVELRVMPCQHQYHRCCLDKWLKIKAVCPICNMNIKDKFLEEERHDRV